MKYWPQWTRRVAMEGSGRDPLGLSRVSDALTNFLLPNIITTTDRARYYSFYTWAIADIEALRNTKGGRISFEEEFQRREAAFALASRLGQKIDLPIVGVRQVDTILASADNGDNVETDFRVLPSNSTGGYGQYYGGCLHGLDLVRVDENGEFVVSTEHGRKLADAFAAATAKSPYLKGNWKTRPRVPKTVLQESAEVFSLDALAGRPADTERELLISLFFNLGESPSATRPLNRQATLGMFLHVLRSCEEAGIEVTRREVDGDAVFWPHYYSGLADDDHALLPYQPAPAFAEAHAFWRQFSAHQLLAFALEEFLAAVLDALSPHPEGLTQSALLDELVNKVFVQDLKKVMQADCSTPAALLKAVGITGIPDVATCLAVSQRFHGESALNEWSVCWDREMSPETRLGRATVLLALLYGKWRGRNDEDALLRVAEEAGNELWLGTMFPWLDDWLVGQMDWLAAVAHLLEWIAMRHDQVKFQKRKLDASWFELANVRPDLFDPRRPVEPQLALLPQALVRNNKYHVTNLRGERLFQEPQVSTIPYHYNPEEAAFYQMMTDFIASGRAYATGLQGDRGRTVMLVLIALQKLASSSVAAVRGAVQKRLSKLRELSSRVQRNLSPATDATRRLECFSDDPDSLNPVVEDEIATLYLELMENECDRLAELIAAADRVVVETKIATIIAHVRALPRSESVLFFTEYKITQAKLLAALWREFGTESASFINGDEALPGVLTPSGDFRDLRESRDTAKDKFNSGEIRFLISTEAAGEGVDLQERCSRLIHVDLPWNPMRLHQRVGRLNRIGQGDIVKVMLFQNPDTVESRIWELLNEKLERIRRSINAVAEEPEDLHQLVLGILPELQSELRRLLRGSSLVRRGIFWPPLPGQLSLRARYLSPEAVVTVIRRGFDVALLQRWLTEVENRLNLTRCVGTTSNAPRGRLHAWPRQCPQNGWELCWGRSIKPLEAATRSAATLAAASHSFLKQTRILRLVVSEQQVERGLIKVSPGFH